MSGLNENEHVRNASVEEGVVLWARACLICIFR